MAPTTNRCQARRDHEIIATAHLTEDVPLQLGDRITIGRTRGTITEIGPPLSDGEIRLVVQLELQARSDATQHSDARLPRAHDLPCPLEE